MTDPVEHTEPQSFTLLIDLLSDSCFMKESAFIIFHHNIMTCSACERTSTDNHDHVGGENNIITANNA